MRPGGEPILTRMTETGYDAMTLGNREFHVADALLRLKISGLRVGVFGLTVPMVTPRMTARIVSAFVFDDPVSAAREQIARLRPHVDALIALTHIGLREDERLASACPELDLIIGGHSHNKLHAPQVVSGVPIVQAGWFGHFLGETQLTWDAGAKKPSVTGRLVDLR